MPTQNWQQNWWFFDPNANQQWWSSFGDQKYDPQDEKKSTNDLWSVVDFDFDLNIDNHKNNSLNIISDPIANQQFGWMPPMDFGSYQNIWTKNTNEYNTSIQNENNNTSLDFDKNSLWSVVDFDFEIKNTSEQVNNLEQTNNLDKVNVWQNISIPEQVNTMEQVNFSEKVNFSEQTSIPEQVNVSEQVNLEQVNVVEQISIPEQVNTTEQVNFSEKVNFSEQISIPEQVNVSEQVNLEQVNAVEQISIPEQVNTVEQVNAVEQVNIWQNINIPEKVNTVEQVNIAEQTNISEQVNIAEQTIIPEQINAMGQVSVWEKTNNLEKVNIVEQVSVWEIKNIAEQLNVAEKTKVQINKDNEIFISKDYNLYEIYKKMCEVFDKIININWFSNLDIKNDNEGSSYLFTKNENGIEIVKTKSDIQNTIYFDDSWDNFMVYLDEEKILDFGQKIDVDLDILIKNKSIMFFDMLKEQLKIINSELEYSINKDEITKKLNNF